MTQFNDDAFKFLRQLKNNNNKEWFAKHKDRYIKIKEDMEHIASAMSSELAMTTPTVKGITPEFKVFRIYKDVRFSKDKKPYKTNLGAILGNKGINEVASFYFHLEPNNSFLGGGLYCPSSSKLARVRQKIATNMQEFETAILKKPFTNYYQLEGSTLKTIPRGFSKEHPAAKYLRYKDYLGTCKVSDQEVQEKGFARRAVKILKALTPLINFLNES